MPREYSFEVRERAEELYIVDGLTYEQVAHQTGVSVAQLKRWAAQGGWSSRRREYRRDLRDIKRKTVKLKLKLVEKALETLDPQVIYALSRLQAATRGTEERPAEDMPEQDIKETVKEIIAREYGIER